MPCVGSWSGSLRRRSSMGSMPRVPASSSTADSSAKVPTDSPGARMKVFATMSMCADCTRSSKLPAPYMHWVPRMNGSGRLLWAVMATAPVWMIASNWPSISR